MEAYILKGLVSQNIIDKINKFIYKPKDSQFIAKKLQQMIWHVDSYQIWKWKKLVRDSRNVVIDEESVNFATLLLNCLQGSSFNYQDQWGQLFEKFFIQAVKNNVKLLMCSYHAGMGPGSAYYLIVEFVQNSYVFSKYSEMTAMWSNFFRIFKSLIEGGYFDGKLVEMKIQIISTSHTAQAIQLILQFYARMHQKQQQNIFIDYIYPSVCQSLCILFGLVSEINYFHRRNLRAIRRKYYHNNQLSNIEFQRLDCPQTVNNAHKILQIVEDKLNNPQRYKFLIKCIQNSNFKSFDVKFVLNLLLYPNIFKIMFDAKTIFKLFADRKMNIVSIIWANQQWRQNILEMRVEGKNILQTVADSYGLTFNLISMLWESGRFKQMPMIRNKKSRDIIEQKYKKQCEQSKFVHNATS